MERQMDALGRIVLPAGYRKQKNLQAGDVLCVKTDDLSQKSAVRTMWWKKELLSHGRHTLC